MGLRDLTDEGEAVMREERARVESEKLAARDAGIAAVAASDPIVARLATVPGDGPVTAR